MGNIAQRNLACLNQKTCKSSDARQMYDDGTSYCFSCSTFFKKGHDINEVHVPKETKPKHKELPIEEIKGYISRGFKERGITKVVCEFFNVKSSFNSAGEIDAHYYPYNNQTGYKCRKLPKDFRWIGTPAPDGLFGMDLFSGGGKRLIITEGEIDALSIAQATYDKYSKFYPVVSVPSSTSLDGLLKHRDWIRSFQEVVLCLDMDDNGEEATKKAISIIGIDKVKLWKPSSDCKDPNDVLMKHGWEALYRHIWDAAPYSPAGIIKTEDIWKQITERNSVVSVPYPDCLTGINSKIKGMRMGEIALFISGTGSGKSTIIREVCLHVIETTTDKIGIISLEESPGETGIKLSGMAINRNPANEEIPDGDLRVGFDKIFGTDRVVVLDHQGAIKDGSIVDQLEYMCLMGCKYLLIDHITILVSEGAGDLEGNAAIDKIMNDLLRLVKRHNVWIGLVSHLRKVASGKKPFEEGHLPTMDDIRGSGSIKQVSFDIIAFARNMVAPDENTRNTIEMSVLKSRTIGLTGRVPGAVYDHATGRLTATSEYVSEQFEEF